MSSDATVHTNGHESFEKLLSRIGRGKGLSAFTADGEMVNAKKTPLEVGAVNGSVYDLGRMVKVFDPINKQAYRLRLGGEKTELLPTAGLDSYLSRAAGNKRVFLCKKYQARQCRAQNKCNSIHADRKKISELREQFPASEDAIKSEKHVEVYSELDNERFSVPLDRVIETAGSHLMTRMNSIDDSQGSVSSAGGSMSGVGIVCQLHDQKVPNCPMGNMCENIHIDPAYLRHTKSMWKMPCCSQQECPGNHNTSSKKQLAFPKLSGNRSWEFFQVTEGSCTGLHPALAVTPTKGLKELCEAETGDVLSIPPTNVCRPHQRKACKWGVDCNNVHICRIQLPPGGRRASPGTSPKNVNVEPLRPPTDECPPLLDAPMPFDEAASAPIAACDNGPATSPINSPVPDLSPLLKRFQSCYSSKGATKAAPPQKDKSSSFFFLSILC
eukprot:gene12897-19888_t